MEAVLLRRANPADASLFYQVIAETMRGHIIATWGAWDEERVRAESREHAASPYAQVILCDGAPVGVFLVERTGSHFQLDQIYVLPEHQRRGIGSRLVRDLIAEARTNGLPLRLRVLAVNPARHFYEKLGFAVTSVTSERVYMERAP